MTDDGGVHRRGTAYLLLGLCCAAALGGCGSEASGHRLGSGNVAANDRAAQLCRTATSGFPGTVAKVDSSTAGEQAARFRRTHGHDDATLSGLPAGEFVALCTLRPDAAHTGSPAVSQVVMAVTGDGRSTWVDGALAR